MSKTKIERTEKTTNPIVGCTKISAGCRGCYAEKLAWRWACKYGKNPEKYHYLKKYAEVVDPKTKGWNGKTFFDESALQAPLKRKKPAMYFMDSMGDIALATYEQFVKIMIVIKQCEQHTFQMLTKRPEKLLKLCASLYEHGSPPKNLWLGVTAENQEMADKRIPILLQIPAAVRFVSIEPCLGEIDLEEYLSPLNAETCSWGDSHRNKTCDCRHTKLDQVIVGGESGPGARPMHPEWARSILRQCTDYGVPFFFKQWGEYLIGDDPIVEKTNTLSFWPKRVKVIGNDNFFRVGKKKAGRLLDGEEYKETPR